MNNIYLFKYTNIKNKDYDHYNSLIENINKNINELSEYVNSKNNLMIKKIIEVEEKASSTKYNQNILEKVFKEILVTNLVDNRSIFVILFGDPLSFIRSFLNDDGKIIKSLISFCHRYSLVKHKLSPGLYNRVIINFAYSDNYRFKDLFDKDSEVFINNLSSLINDVIDGRYQLETIDEVVKEHLINSDIENIKSTNVNNND